MLQNTNNKNTQNNVERTSRVRVHCAVSDTTHPPQPRVATNINEQLRPTRGTLIAPISVSVVDGGGETPGPIPNPEAKPARADGTAPGREWESRLPPTQQLQNRKHPRHFPHRDHGAGAFSRPPSVKNVKERRNAARQTTGPQSRDARTVNASAHQSLQFPPAKASGKCGHREWAPPPTSSAPGVGVFVR